MVDFYEEIEDILLEGPFKSKIEKFNTFLSKFESGDMDFVGANPPKRFTTPSYAKICNIVPPQKVPKRSNFATSEGRAKLLHAIAHIEYSAIDLALDAAYRFRGLPEKFYEDWIEVAKDEVYHFELIETLLEELGYEYGDFDVHSSIFEASVKTGHSLLERMAVIPRYLEANGLDATPMILKKLQNFSKDNFIKRVIEALHIILDEEVSHVKKGDYWFKWACKQESLEESVYFDIIKKYYPNEFVKNKNVNIQARIEAGFSCNELNIISQKKVC
ncbi:MAG: ferritin-like domain-containing protein [Epsilonproteobacteria bacterium]|nr:ferritin-like domain-containing protein [Campylobacterota bacterium]